MKKGADLDFCLVSPANENRDPPPSPVLAAAALSLIRLATLLLARTFTRQRLFGAAPISRLQIVGVLLDILDDIFLLHLTFEATKRAFNRFAFLNLDFSQA
jgi:hypothetical protein